MSEAETIDFEPTFNRSIKVRSRDDRITSNAGVLLLRETDHRLGLVESLVQGMYDPRQQEWVRYFLLEFLRERIYSLALNYRATDNVDLLAHDAVVRMAVWGKDLETAQLQLRWERETNFPTEASYLAPTALGNILNASSSRVWQRYQIDWPHCGRIWKPSLPTKPPL